jgi:hypothetical protein
LPAWAWPLVLGLAAFTLLCFVGSKPEVLGMNSDGVVYLLMADVMRALLLICMALIIDHLHFAMFLHGQLGFLPPQTISLLMSWMVFVFLPLAHYHHRRIPLLASYLPYLRRTVSLHIFASLH